MYELKIISHFAGAHQLRNFKGSCEKLHGHNWKVEVCVRGERLGEDGTLVDFQEIKEATKHALDTLDHEFLNELEPFREENPSSENIARYIFRFVAEELADRPVTVSKVTAWESDTACATYYENE
ncbi:MAG: 6-carboxytetrahydropterin synthase QueD [Deltaproteobacteria bacterium]|nr:6-carboxytetrahydropterin synthase QueD [Deltaproteobacteria bacterium]MBW1931037.1 6-carboxytetrahydropterin synthase QueD [Deltaproteobacteria bacterium]MBW2026137.1 6-carboxytetrahydropterin synthase QueD [Deltaproteobacteria bacterium]MBW2126875.1 6-carboxytetrahydropterin synthase QueD [Deltaproteobacteria bacterium]RLB22379.1 MAG: 6-carboxytetrahydropterin synthase QueD [Deltaproteobacteria bacterium]